MFLDGLSFLEEEREAWRPFEALDTLPDDILERPVEAAHGWSGRDLMAHLTACQDLALRIARELAVGEASQTLERSDAEWETRGSDAVNAELQAAWATLPMAEVRRRFRETPGELRGYLTVVPEIRWVKHQAHMQAFAGETLDHYDEHQADLAAILAAAGR
jgi:hypothetical protein